MNRLAISLIVCWSAKHKSILKIPIFSSTLVSPSKRSLLKASACKNFAPGTHLILNSISAIAHLNMVAVSLCLRTAQGDTARFFLLFVELTCAPTRAVPVAWLQTRLMKFLVLCWSNYDQMIIASLKRRSLLILLVRQPRQLPALNHLYSHSFLCQGIELDECIWEVWESSGLILWMHSMCRFILSKYRIRKSLSGSILVPQFGIILP